MADINLLIKLFNLLGIVVILIFAFLIYVRFAKHKGSKIYKKYWDKQIGKMAILTAIIFGTIYAIAHF